MAWGFSLGGRKKGLAKGEKANFNNQMLGNGAYFLKIPPQTHWGENRFYLWGGKGHFLMFSKNPDWFRGEKIFYKMGAKNPKKKAIGFNFWLSGGDPQKPFLGLGVFF